MKRMISQIVKCGISLIVIASFQNISMAQSVEIVSIAPSHVVSGESFVFDEVLYIKMFDWDDGGHDDLFKFTEEGGLVEVTSPVGYDEQFRGYLGKAFVFKGDLYLKYIDNNGNVKLFLLDGDDLIEIENTEYPDGSYFGDPILFNDEMYFRYRTTHGVTLAKMDGNEIKTIDTQYKMIEPFIYKNLLYYISFLDPSTYGLVAFDGQNIEEKETLQYGICCGPKEYFPIVVDDNVYLRLGLDELGQETRLFRYDGNNFIKISGTTNLASETQTYKEPFVSGNEIYYLGIDDSEGILLRYTEGSTVLDDIEAPSGSNFRNGFLGYVFFFQDELHLAFSDNDLSLAKVNGNTIEIVLSDFDGDHIVFNDALFFKRFDNGVKLMKYDGNLISEVSPELSYFGQPIIYNDNLYVVVNSGDGNGNVLGRVIDAPLSTTIKDTTILYPNPASDHIFINTDSSIPITIINTLGQKVLKGISNKRIDISSLESGVYFIQFAGGENLKLIKE